MRSAGSRISPKDSGNTRRPRTTAPFNEHSGTALLGTGQTRSAADDFKAVLAEAPNNDQARAGLKKVETLDNY